MVFARLLSCLQDLVDFGEPVFQADDDFPAVGLLGPTVIVALVGRLNHCQRHLRVDPLGQEHQHLRLAEKTPFDLVQRLGHFDGVAPVYNLVLFHLVDMPVEHHVMSVDVLKLLGEVGAPNGVVGDIGRRAAQPLKGHLGGGGEEGRACIS